MGFVINFIVTYWNKQTVKEKFFIVGLLLSLIYGVYHKASKAYYKYQYFKSAVEQRDTFQDSIQVLNKKIDKQYIKLKNTTVRAKNNSKEIDKKLEQDEKAIDNSVIDDDKRKRILSRFDTD